MTIRFAMRTVIEIIMFNINHFRLVIVVTFRQTLMNVPRQAASVPTAIVRTSWAAMNVFVIQDTKRHRSRLHVKANRSLVFSNIDFGVCISRIT